MACSDRIIDVMFVLDVSPSVALTSALAAVIAGIESIQAQNEADGGDRRVGIVWFSNIHSDGFGDFFGPHATYLDPPGLTADLDALLTAAAALTTGSGSDVAAGLTLAASTLESAAGPGSQCSLVLISDGQWSSAYGVDPVPVAAAIQVAHPDWKLFAVDITVGTNNGVMPTIGAAGDGYAAGTTSDAITDAVVRFSDPCPHAPAEPPEETASVELFVYDGDGNRTLLDADAYEIEWEILERGGFGAGSLKILGTWEEFGPAAIVGNEQVDVYLFGQPAYRGWVRTAQNEIANPELADPNLYGFIERLGSLSVERKFAYGCDTDLSVIFQDLVAHCAERDARLAAAVVQVETIGVTAKELDARGKGLAQAVNQLCDLAPNQTIWGHDFDDAEDWRGYRENRLYLRKRNTTVTSAYALGDNVTAMKYPRDISRVQNRIKVRGSSAAQANQLSNGSFEDLVPASETEGNLLLNASFEDETLGNYWTLGSGATVKYAGHPTAHGSARTGHQWLECDTNGEYGYQDASIIGGRKYTGVAHARLEDAEEPNAGVIRLQGLNASGTVVAEESLAFNTVAGPDAPALSGLYNRYAVELDTALYPTVVKCRLRLESSGGSAANDGVLFDDAGIYESCAAAQSLWRVTPTGNATIEALDWECAASLSGGLKPRNGGLCVRVKAANLSTVSDTVELYQVRANSPSVQPNERYTMVLFWHVDGVGLTSDEALTFGVQNVRSDNTLGTLVESNSILGNVSGWTAAVLDVVTDHDTARLQPFIRSRTTRNLYLDDVMVVQGEAPADVLDHGCWWSGSDFEAEIDVTNADLITAGLSAEAQDSIDTYGIRQPSGGVDASGLGVTDYASLLLYAKPYLDAYAVPEIAAELSIEGPRELLKQTGLVRLLGIEDGPLDLFPSRIHYAVNTSIRLTAELGSQLPIFADLFALTRTRTQSTSSSSSSSSSSSGSSGGSGGTSAPTLRVEEIDGAPTIPGVSKLRVPNGTLTDEGGGVARFEPASSLPSATAVGTFLGSVDGSTFQELAPVTDAESGWLLDGDGYMLVEAV